jgi:protection-of-telomeres protein 1
MVTFKICDQTCPDETSSVPIRAFKPIMDQLPQIHSDGDIILIKSIKLQRYQDKIYGIVSPATTWIISYLPAIANTVPSTITFPTSMKPQPMEFSQLKGLRNWWTSVGGATSSDNAHMGNYQNMPASSSMPHTNNYQMTPVNNHQVMAFQGNAYQNQAPYIKKGTLKFSLIRDMKVNNFYDLIGLVVKTFSATQNYTLYITDYSRNSMVHSYEWPGNNTVEEGNFSRAKQGGGEWPGPWGQYTLQITLWDAHASAARQILEDTQILQNMQDGVGVYVGLKNVRAKKNGDGRLEGVLHGDKTMRPGLYMT